MGTVIRKFKDRKPSKPFPWIGVELQFYERFEEADVVEMQLDEESQEIEVVVLYAYKEYKLSWRPEFSQKAEYDEKGELVKQDYVTGNYEVLLAEAKEQF